MANILTVDDSTSMRQMVALTLTKAGHHVQQAYDGKHGLMLAQTMAFDLVLTDFNMPVMNGIMLTQSLRQLDNYRFTPILLFTTENSIENKQLGRSAGATGWLVKPCQPEQLLSTVNKVLGQ